MITRKCFTNQDLPTYSCSGHLCWHHQTSFQRGQHQRPLEYAEPTVYPGSKAECNLDLLYRPARNKLHACPCTTMTGYEPLLAKLLISQILAGRHPVCVVHSQWKHPHNAESTQKQCKCKSIWSTSAQEGVVVPDTLQTLSRSQSKCLKVQLLLLPHCLGSHCLAESFWQYFSVFDLTWCCGGIQDVAKDKTLVVVVLPIHTRFETTVHFLHTMLHKYIHLFWCVHAIMPVQFFVV